MSITTAEEDFEDESDDLEYQSLEDWNNEGYSVISGEKSRRRSFLGVPLFGSDQVEETDWSDR